MIKQIPNEALRSKYAVYLLMFLTFFSLYAQNKKTTAEKKSSGKWIQIRHADVLRFDKNRSDAQILLGSVCCEHEGTFLYCDSAFIRGSKWMDAYGNVRIVKGDSLQITGNEMNYDATNKRAVITGSVICIHKNMRMETPELYYNTEKNIAGYFSGATIYNQQTVLKSKHGHYVAKEEMLYFHYDVEITDPEFRMKSDTLKYYLPGKTAYFFGPSVIFNDKDYIYCLNGFYDTQKQISSFGKGSLLQSENVRMEGDSLFYNHKTEQGISLKKVRITDTSEKSNLYGQYAYYQAKGPFFWITGRALYSRKAEKDSLHLHADTLRYHVVDSTHKYIRAGRNVKIFHPGYQVWCDSLYFRNTDSSLHLYGKPLLWSGLMQCSSDTMHVFLSDTGIRYVLLKNKVLMVQKADSIEKNNFFHQATGEDALLYFNGYEPHFGILKGENDVIYFIRSKKKYTGMSRTHSGESRLYFKNGDLNKAVSKGKINGNVIPIQQCSDEKMFLPVFFYESNRRPKCKEDVFK